MRVRVLAAALLLGGCGGGAPAGPGEFQVRFVVTNALLAPVTLSVDGTPYVGLSGGRSSGLAVSSRAQWLSWTSAKPTDEAGTPIPDEIGEVRIAVAAIGPTLEITNVIDGETYFTARLFNNVAHQMAIGVAEGARVACAGVLNAASRGTPGVLQIGYYHLRRATELRAYPDSRRCEGPHVAWPPSALAAPAPGSGLVLLTVDALP